MTKSEPRIPIRDIPKSFKNLDKDTRIDVAGFIGKGRNYLSFHLPLPYYAQSVEEKKLKEIEEEIDKFLKKIETLAYKL